MYNNPFREGNFIRPSWDDYDDFETTSFGPSHFGSPPAGQMPMGTPPGFSPPIPAWRVGSSGIRACLFRNTYIWMNNGRSFWFYPTAIGREFIVGFRWSRRYGWHFRTIVRNQIRSYECFQ
ncbi:hypothetical protein I6G82_20980 [Lysinibacillus macroides]|uniref:Transporter n=1 Tax=Lysinibacillus macroides TaxID=33935 RepID=A0A0N0UW58_9BACI|nr:hypothetical protein [Lysinibacillus macroides]KOY80335.1 hypothetical protein ADM90_21065 [Lysinibacillus macroides]QPR67644.1 hypothetical protein I6G82_20980 [Lysinibacillus macroides]